MVAILWTQASALSVSQMLSVPASLTSLRVVTQREDADEIRSHLVCVFLYICNPL